MKKFTFMALLLMGALSASFTSCSSDDDDDNNINNEPTPEVVVNNYEGVYAGDSLSFTVDSVVVDSAMVTIAGIDSVNYNVTLKGFPNDSNAIVWNAAIDKDGAANGKFMTSDSTEYSYTIKIAIENLAKKLTLVCDSVVK